MNVNEPSSLEASLFDVSAVATHRGDGVYGSPSLYASFDRVGSFCNAWWANGLDPLACFKEGSEIWHGAGGTVDPRLLWGSHLTALRYCQCVYQEEEQMVREIAFPFQTISQTILECLQGTPFSMDSLDVFALGSGAAFQEQWLLQGLRSLFIWKNIRTFLLDASLPMLQLGQQRLTHKFSQEKEMQFVGLNQSIQRLGMDSNWVQSIRHTSRLPVVTLLGEGFGLLPNELKFLRHNVGFFPAHTLLLLDVTNTYGPVEQPRDLYRLDPFLNGQCVVRQRVEPFLQKVIQDNRPATRRVAFQAALDRSNCLIPNSYAVELQARLGESSQFFIPQGRRYDEAALLKTMEEERWVLVEKWTGLHPDKTLCLFAKQPRSSWGGIATGEKAEMEASLFSQQLTLPATMLAQKQADHALSWSDYPSNAWMDPNDTSVHQLQELVQLIKGRGGLLDSRHLCLDEQAALDYEALVSIEQDRFGMERMPVDAMADHVAGYLEKTPFLPKSLDVLALACGFADMETQLVRALLQRTGIQDIRICLVDASIPVLRRAQTSISEKFSSFEGVTVTSLAMNALQLHRHVDLVSAFQQTNRLLLVTLFGEAFGGFSNELDLVRNSLRLLPRRSLWLLDAGLVYAPAEDMKKVCTLDPGLNGQDERWNRAAARWLTGMFKRHRSSSGTEHYELKTSLDRGSGMVPGSYTLDTRVIMDREVSFSVLKRTRYEEPMLLQLLEQHGWSGLEGWFYNQGNRLMQLLEKK